MTRDFSEDKGGEAVERDLFGAPVTAIRERWGRPAFAKGPENQELVCLLVGSGWSQKRIARYLRCDEKTLRKHFSRELEEGADRIEAMGLQVLLKKMRSGHSMSTNRLLDIVEERGHPAPPVPRVKPVKAEPLGKKEQAIEDARTAHEDTGWGELLDDQPDRLN